MSDVIDRISEQDFAFPSILIHRYLKNRSQQTDMDKVLIYTVYAAYMQCLVIGMGGVTDRTTIKVLTTLKVTGHTQDHTLSGFTHTAAVVLSRKDSKSRGKKSQSQRRLSGAQCGRQTAKQSRSCLACFDLLGNLVQQNH